MTGRARQRRARGRAIHGSRYSTVGPDLSKGFAPLSKRTSSLHKRRLTGQTVQPAAPVVASGLCQYLLLRCQADPSPVPPRSVPVKTSPYPSVNRAGHPHTRQRHSSRSLPLPKADLKNAHCSARFDEYLRLSPLAPLPIRDRDAPLDRARHRLLALPHSPRYRSRTHPDRRRRHRSTGEPAHIRHTSRSIVRRFRSHGHVVRCSFSDHLSGRRGIPQARNRAADGSLRPHVRLPDRPQRPRQGRTQVSPDTSVGRDRPGLLARAPLRGNDACDLPGVRPARGARQPRLRRKRREPTRHLWCPGCRHLAIRSLYRALVRHANHRVPRRAPGPGEVHTRSSRASQVSLRPFPNMAARPGGLQRRRNRRPAGH